MQYNADSDAAMHRCRTVSNFCQSEKNLVELEFVITSANHTVYFINPKTCE